MKRIATFTNHAQDSRIKETDVCECLAAWIGTGGCNLPLVLEWDDEGQDGQENRRDKNMPKLPRMTVRRLLPVETERLFGLPDGHTIPCFKPEDITDELVERFIEIFFIWDCFCQSLKKQGEKADETSDDDAGTDSDNDGEVADETQIDDAEELADDGETTEEPTETEPTSDVDVPKLPKKRSAKWVRVWLEKVSNPETCPDAPRYKATGNSFGVNCIRWIGLGIQAVEDSMAEK